MQTLKVICRLLNTQIKQKFPHLITIFIFILFF
jgi:hypothetical protein